MSHLLLVGASHVLHYTQMYCELEQACASCPRLTQPTIGNFGVYRRLFYYTPHVRVEGQQQSLALSQNYGLEDVCLLESGNFLTLLRNTDNNPKD